MKLDDKRLQEILDSRARYAREAGEEWVSELEVHSMAEELLKTRAELKYYRDNNRHSTDDYD